jgi:para-nitrobenzyl esterase
MFGLAASAMAAASSTVMVQGTTLQGTVASDHREFLGVPYAAPPTENLRFKPPQPSTAYSGGTIDATQFHDACPQAGPGSVQPSSEDCLYLNIYTPLKEKKLPVMVWIHGGGFVNGAGSIYDGATLAKKGNVIVVTINYRLAAFGFLATSALAAENNGASGNYGIMDQQQALQWVKTNISNFGGNPDNVTIFGGSAGAASVATHLASPTSADLFQRAIMQSIPYDFVTASKEQNYAAGEAIIAALGCTNADLADEITCMRGLSVGALNGALAVYTAQGMVSLPKVNIDGTTMETTIDWAIASGDFNHVPVLMGANKNEGRFLWYIAGVTLDAGSYAGLVTAQYGDLAQLVLTTYPVADYSTPDEAYAALLGDSAIACQSRSLTRQLTTAGVPVYAYHFVDPNPPSPMPFIPAVVGPTHGSEVIYVFQDSVPLVEPAQLTTAQKKLSDKMISYWTNFARSGDPNGGWTPDWAEYSNKKDAFLDLSSEAHGIKKTTTYKDDHFCGFWAKYFGL